MINAARQGHVIVFGFRGVARRIVKQLAKAGQHVVVIDPEATAAEIETLEHYGVEYLEGFGQSLDVLNNAGLCNAKAAICVTNDDLRNIEIALLVREMSREVRLVVQMASGPVGKALESVAHPGAVLELARLASTSFVEATLARTTHVIDLDGERFLTASVVAPRSGTLRSLWGEIAPIAVRSAEGDQTVSCPSRDYQASAGDAVTLLGTKGDFAAIGLAVVEPRPVSTPVSMPQRLRDALSVLSYVMDRPIRIALGLLTTLAITSVLLLMYGYVGIEGKRMSLLDAIYFTTETIATVGFGDFYFRTQAPWLRVWAVVMIASGATLVAVTTALLTNALVSRRLESSLGVQRKTGLKDHIVVIGLGAIGSQVAADFRDLGYDVAVIDGGQGQRFIPQMQELGVPVMIGDATLRAMLLAAGVQRAAGVAVLTSDDLINIETGLAVRGVVGERTVPIALRIFGRNLARLVGSGLDAGVARSVAELSSPWFVGAALGLDVIGTFYVGEIPFMAARIAVEDGDPFSGRAIADLGTQTRVVGIKRHGSMKLEHPLSRSTVFHPGDSAFVVGRFEDLLDLFSLGAHSTT